MFKKITQKRVLFAHGSRLLLLCALLLVALNILNIASPRTATAATDSTVNFQARLMTNAGAIVPDGTYNVEFKLYNALTSGTSSQGSCTGDANCLWTETRTSTNRVTVTNGYLTVNLGSVTAFPGTINWDQDLYLGMNIGGTGTPSWDGEMTPRLHLTAVPYAFKAGQLATLNGTHTGTLSFTAPTANDSILLPDASGTVCLQSSAACGFALTSGSGSYIQNGVSSQAANFNVQAATSGSVAATLQANAAGTGDIMDMKNGAGTIVGSYSSTGAVLLQNSTDSTAAFTVKNALNTSTAFDIDTTNTRVGIGTAAPSRTLDVAVNNSTINGLPLLVEQAGTGDVGIELKSASQSYYVGADSTDGNFKISSNTASGATSVYGYNTIGASTDVADQNFISAVKFTAGATGTISSLNAYIASVQAAPNNKAQMGIYTDSSGSPGTLLANSADVALTGPAWNSFPIAPVSVTSGTVYWLAYNTNATSNSKNNYKFDTGATNQLKDVSQTYGTWPSTWSGGSFDTLKPSFYANVSTTTPTNDFNASLFTIGNTGQTTLQNSTDSTSAVRIQNAAGTSNLLIADTTNSRIAIGQASAAYTLDVAGDINTTTALRVAGTSVCDTVGSTGCIAKSGSGFYIHNQNTLQSANMYIQAATSGTVAGVLQANAAGTADILDLKNGSAVNVATFGNTGSVLLQNSTDSITSFVVSTSLAGTNENVLRIDTVSERVAIGVVAGTPSSKLNIATASTVGLRVFESGAFDSFELANATGDVMDVNQGGATTHKTTTNSLNGFLVQNSNSDSLFNIDTTNNTTTIQAGATQTADILQVKNTSGNLLLEATNTSIIVGTGGNNMTISSASTNAFEPLLSGTARHKKSIVLTPEYGGAVLDASNDATCTASSNGTMISSYDLTNRMNYYKWTTSGTNQCYDVVVQVPIPSDFSAWSSTPLSMYTYSSDLTNGTIQLEVRNSSNSVDTNYNFTAMTPSSTTTWQSKTAATQAFGSGYTAGDYMTLRIRMKSPASGDVRLGNITLNYLTAY